jgi:hypothetical protein
MSDILSRLTAEDAPEARDVSINGDSFTVYFRRLNAGEREQLLKGMKITHVPGAKGSIEIDLGENEHQRQLLVWFSACDEQGRRLFKALEAVKKLPHYKLEALARHADEVNATPDEDLGKG